MEKKAEQLEEERRKLEDRLKQKEEEKNLSKNLKLKRIDRGGKSCLVLNNRNQNHIEINSKPTFFVLLLIEPLFEVIVRIDTGVSNGSQYQFFQPVITELNIQFFNTESQ